MKTIRKLMTAVDFSHTSMEALRHAAEVAQSYDASLVIVHVLQTHNQLVPEAYLARSPQFFGEALGETLRELNALLGEAETRAKAAGAERVSSELLQGVTAAEMIVGFARKQACDLIVIGTHGRTGVAHALMGSIAEKVVRAAGCPVLTIRPLQGTASWSRVAAQGSSVKTIAQILVATDFSSNAEKAVRHAAQIARHYGASLMIAHVLPGPSLFVPEIYRAQVMQFGDITLSMERYMGDAKKAAEIAGARAVSTVVLEGGAALELTTFAKAHAFDLIVVGTHGRSALLLALLGSVAERVLRTASCPVMTIP